jgi:hypothetical protein
VVLLGARQVGKTTLATLLAEEEGDRALYLDLELPSDRAKLTDPELYLASRADKLVRSIEPQGSFGCSVASLTAGSGRGPKSVNSSCTARLRWTCSSSVLKHWLAA